MKLVIQVTNLIRFYSAKINLSKGRPQNSNGDNTFYNMNYSNISSVLAIFQQKLVANALKKYFFPVNLLECFKI